MCKAANKHDRECKIIVETIEASKQLSKEQEMKKELFEVEDQENRIGSN